MYGLRHQDAFGAPGTGVFLGLGNQNRFRPIYTGPTAAHETRLHLIASPASIRTTLVDALGNPFFGEREALKLAFAESGRVVPEAADDDSKVMTNLGLQSVRVQPLGVLPALAVPNTIEIGVNQGTTLSAAALAVTGSIQLSSLGTSENDYYSFSGTAGDVVTIEVLSQILRHRIGNPIDSILRVYNSAGQKVAYYTSTLGAFNDDTFEPTDSVLIDLILPTTDTYTVEVDTFSFAAPEFLAYAPAGFSVSQFSANNPNHIAVTDRDTGFYELLIYRFNGTAPALTSGDTLIGGAGNDILIGNSGKEIVFGYNPNQDTLFDPSGGSSFASNPPVLQTIPNQSAFEGATVAFTAQQTDVDGDFKEWRIEPVSGEAYPVGSAFDNSTGAFQFQSLDNGQFAVRIVGADYANMTSSQIVYITIVNAQPVVNAGIDQTVFAGTTVNLLGSFSDAGLLDTHTGVWEVRSNTTGVLIASSNTTSLNFVPVVAGVYTASFTVTDKDNGVGSDSAVITVTSANVNQPPSAVVLSPTSATLPENTDTASEIALATVSVIDDGLGTNVFSLSGPDANSFKIVGNQLRLKAGIKLDFETKSNYNLTVNVDDSSIGTGPEASSVFTLNVRNLLEVASVRVADGTSQRSNVKQLQVTFDGNVAISDLNNGAFTVRQRGVAGGLVATQATTAVVNGRTVVTLTFGGAFVEASGSLKDGNYDLKIIGSKVTFNGESLDGDSDGQVGGDYRFGADQNDNLKAIDNFFRFFGDADGDRDVDASDLGIFSLAYRKKPNAYTYLFDFDADNDVDSLDLAQFNKRYRKTLS